MAANNPLVALLGRIPYGLVAFLILGYFGYQYWDFTQSDDSVLAQKKTQIETSKQENEGLRIRLKEVENFARSLDARRQKLSEYKAILESRKSAVPEELDPVDLTRTLSRKAEDVGIRVLSIQPQGRTRNEFYQEHPFELEFVGVYIQLYRFFQDISTISPLVRIPEFSMRPVGSTSSRFVTLQGKVKMVAYSYVTSEADAVATAQPAKAGGPSPSSAGKAGGGGG